jgi:archaemetzincin
MELKPDPRPRRPEILIVPLGTVEAEILSWLVGALKEVLGLETTAGEPFPLPADSYDARRRQYRGELLLAALHRQAGAAFGRVLGLAGVDCYAGGLNFIFGQASSWGRVAFVALPRLRESFYNPRHEGQTQPEGLDLFRERVLKEAVHELGHTWGLAHCPDARCVMHFSNSLFDTDLKRATYCADCVRAWAGARSANTRRGGT